MRSFFQAVAVFLAIAAGSLYALRESGRLAPRRSAPPYRSDPVTPKPHRPILIPAPPEKPAEDLHDSGALPDGPAPSLTSLAGVEESIRTWRPPPIAGAERMMISTLEADPRWRTLAAQWRLRRWIVEVPLAAEPQVPDRIHRVRLTNGSVLWAHSVRQDDSGTHLILLRGIETTLATRDIADTEILDRQGYSDATSAEFRQELERLGSASASAILRSLCRALRRQELSRAEILYERWLSAGGPTTESLPTETRGPLIAAWQELRNDEGSASPRVVAPPERRDNPPPSAAPRGSPTSLDDLEKKLATTRSRLSRPYGQVVRDRETDRLTQWSVWLEATEAGRTRTEAEETRLRTVRRQIQVLLVELLETSK